MFRPVVLASAFVLLAMPVSMMAAELKVTATSAGGAAPIGAQRVPFLSMALENSCDEATALLSMRVRHRGLGDTQDIARMYVMQNNRRISASASSFDDGYLTIRFRRFTLAPCARSAIDLVGDFSNDAAPEGQHTFEIIGIETANQANVRVGGGVSIVTSKAGQSAPLLTAKMLALPRLLTYGARRVLARLQLAGDRTKDQLIRSIMFTNDGSAKDRDLQNLFLEKSNGDDLSAAVPFLDGDQVKIVFAEPFLLSRNQVIVLSLKGDVRASRRRTVRFVIDEPGDIEATIRRRAKSEE